jgi:hypothetical protein
LNEFLGFLEGRLRRRIPKWWCDAVRDARANNRENVYVPDQDGGRLAAIPGTQTPVTKNGDRFVLRVGNDAIDLPNDLLAGLVQNGQLSGLANFSAHFTKTNCYVAIHDDVGYPYRLGCVSRSNGKLVWQAEGWGLWWYGFGGAVGKARVTVDVQDDRVLVFWCNLHVSAEGFRADNGKALFRFANTYSEHYE